ncbi:hypothetical protein SRHO_G00226560 [Serrasalmus rhombeus]
MRITKAKRRTDGRRQLGQGERDEDSIVCRNVRRNERRRAEMRQERGMPAVSGAARYETFSPSPSRAVSSNSS